MGPADGPKLQHVWNFLMTHSSTSQPLNTLYEGTLYWVYVNNMPVLRTNNEEAAYKRYYKELREQPHKTVEVQKIVQTTQVMVRSVPRVQDRTREMNDA